MSNVSDNLPTCYAYTVILVCSFPKGFVLPSLKASFIRSFILGLFFDYNFNFYVSPIQIKYISAICMLVRY